MASVQQKILTDTEVIRTVLDGDQEAFAVIVERYQKGLANYIFHMVRHYEESLELTQEVFLKAYANLSSFDSAYKFSTWLYKIASNHTIDHMRKQRAPESPIEVPDDEGGGTYELPLESHGQSPHESLAMKDMMGRIREAVEELPSSYRELVILRHFNFRSYEEMAKITGLPLGTVKNRIFRARQMLMERLKDVR